MQLVQESVGGYEYTNPILCDQGIICNKASWYLRKSETFKNFIKPFYLSFSFFLAIYLLYIFFFFFRYSRNSSI